jgi:hypothetical protein
MMLKLTKLSSITKIFASIAIAIAMNVAYAPISNHLRSDAIAAENPPVSAETKQLIDRLTGQWQLVSSINTPDTLTLIFIFTADGKLYLVNTNQKSAFLLEYQVNTTNGQTYLDILQGSFASRITVDFSQKGQLILQQLVVPAAFQYSGNILGGLLLPNALFLNRISDDTNLPKDVEVASPQSSVSSARQSEAKTYVGSMNRSQQAFFLEKNYFVIVDTDDQLRIRNIIKKDWDCDLSKCEKNDYDCQNKIQTKFESNYLDNCKNKIVGQYSELCLNIGKNDLKKKYHLMNIIII